jgi:hypothetical protein
MIRIILLLLILFMSVSTMAGNWFPDDFKNFPFKEGDVLASKGENGKYGLNKVLRIDKVVLQTGESINIQGQLFTAPEEDFLLIISMSYGENEFSTLEEAKTAAKNGVWKTNMGHVPNRAPGAAVGQILVGNQSVKSGELVGYNQWKKLFDEGKAGVF